MTTNQRFLTYFYSETLFTLIKNVRTPIIRNPKFYWRNWLGFREIQVGNPCIKPLLYTNTILYIWFPHSQICERWDQTSWPLTISTPTHVLVVSSIGKIGPSSWEPRISNLYFPFDRIQMDGPLIKTSAVFSPETPASLTSGSISPVRTPESLEDARDTGKGKSNACVAPVAIPIRLEIEFGDKLRGRVSQRNLFCFNLNFSESEITFWLFVFILQGDSDVLLA